MAEERKKLTAYLYSSTEPSEKQKERFISFITKKYEVDTELEWVLDESQEDGFKLVVGEEVYNWNKEGRLHQLREMLAGINAADAENAGNQRSDGAAAAGGRDSARGRQGRGNHAVPVHEPERAEPADGAGCPGRKLRRLL